MFSFRGAITGGRYITWCLSSIGLFAVSISLLPFLIGWIAQGCSGVNGACGALALVVAFYFKPPVAALFLFSLIGPAVGRARDAGLNPWMGLAIPLLFIPDYQFFLFGGAPWSFAFSAGVLGFSLPYHAMLGVVAMAALALLPRRVDWSSSRLARTLGMVALAVLALVLLLAVLRFAVVGGLSGAVLGTVAPVFVFEPYLMLVCGVLLLSVAVVVRLAARPATAEESRQASGDPAPAPASALRLPLTSLMITAVVMALAAIAASQGGEQLLFELLTFTLGFTLIPTALIYLLPLLAITLLMKRRWLLGAVVGVVAVQPFASWAQEAGQSIQLLERLQAELAALPDNSAIGSYPPTLMGNSGRFKGAEIGISRNISGAPGNYHSTQVTTGKRRQVFKTTKIDELPSRYLLLRTYKDSRFYVPEPPGYPAPYAYIDRTPYELVLVTDAGEQFIAAQVKFHVLQPTAIPLLGFSGWITTPDRGVSGNRTDASIEAFLKEALAGAQPETDPAVSPYAGSAALR